jgi:hypothetical protein
MRDQPCPVCGAESSTDTVERIPLELDLPLEDEPTHGDGDSATVTELDLHRQPSPLDRWGRR